MTKANTTLTTKREVLQALIQSTLDKHTPLTVGEMLFFKDFLKLTDAEAAELFF